MKTQQLKVLTATLLLASCAQTQTKQSALDIQPFQEVRHSYEQAKAQYELGRYYQGQLRYTEAIEAYRQALATNPGMVDALNAMGAAYAETGNLALARQQFEAALKLQPQSAYTYNNLGFVSYLAGDYAAAVQAYKEALRLDAGEAIARQNLVLAYGRMGEAGQIVRTEVPAVPVAVQPAAEKIASQKAPESAWVKISPQIYEMHSAVVEAEQHAVTPITKVAEAAPVERVTKVDAAPLTRTVSIESVMPGGTAASSAAPSLPLPVAARSTDAKPSISRTAFEAAPVAAVGEPRHGRTHVATSLQGVEVSNGNGIRGLAAKVARYFLGKGIQQARVTNQKPFSVSHTHIEYRAGSAAEADRLNKLLPKAVPLAASNSLRKGIRVRLVLGHDQPRNIVAWDSQPETGMVTAGLTGMELPNL